MEKIDKIIEILQAFKDGKRVEYFNNGDWHGVANANIILNRLNTSIDTLRIAQEPKYRPYANAEEFSKDSKEHGPYIKKKGYGGCHCLIVAFTDTDVAFSDSEFSCEYDIILNNYIWQDGSPCGILKN